MEEEKHGYICLLGRQCEFIVSKKRLNPTSIFDTGLIQRFCSSPKSDRVKRVLFFSFLVHAKCQKGVRKREEEEEKHGYRRCHAVLHMMEEKSLER